MFGIKQMQFHSLSKSQNHRVGGDLWGSSSSTPLPKQGHLQQAVQDLVQAGSEYLQRRRIHNLSAQPVPVLCHPQSKEVLLHVQTELPMLQFVPVAPCPVTGHHWKESGPILLTPTLQIFRGISKVPSQPSLLQAEQAQLSQPFPRRATKPEDSIRQATFKSDFCPQGLKKTKKLKFLQHLLFGSNQVLAGDALTGALCGSASFLADLLG